MLKLVTQPENIGICGQCAMAMITGRPVSEIVYHLQTLDGTTARQRTDVLISYYASKVVEQTKVDNRKHIDLSGLGIVAISTTRGKKHGHAMAFKDGAIYDPGGRVFRDYKEMLAYYKDAWNGARVRHIAYVELREVSIPQLQAAGAYPL